MELNKDELKEICLDVIEVEEDEIGMDQEFRSFSHIDSLKALDMMNAIERYLKVKLPEKIMREFESINGVINAVENHLKMAKDVV